MFSKNKITSGITLVLIVGAILLGNRLLQTYLGEQALDNTGLEILTLEQAIDRAQGQNKLILADMSAIYCPTCRKLDNTIFANPEVKATINQSFVFARIEYSSEEGEAFMQKYDVRGFPTVLVLNQFGEKMVHMPLLFDPDKYSQLLKQASSRFR